MTLCNVRNVLHRNVFPYVGGGKGNDSSSPPPPASSIYLPTPHTFFDALFAYLPTHALRHSVHFLLGVCIFRSRKWVTCRLLTFPHTFFGTRCALFSVYVYSGCASGWRALDERRSMEQRQASVPCAHGSSGICPMGCLQLANSTHLSSIPIVATPHGMATISLVTWRIHIQCDTTHSYPMWHWFIHIPCDMTHSYTMWHHSFYPMWHSLNHIPWDMTHSCPMWHDSYISHVTWLLLSHMTWLNLFMSHVTHTHSMSRLPRFLGLFRKRAVFLYRVAKTHRMP